MTGVEAHAEEPIGELYRHFCGLAEVLAERERDPAAGADLSIVELSVALESLSLRIVRAQPVRAEDLTMKIDVLRRWFLADFWLDDFGEDSAGEALRLTFSQIEAHLLRETAPTHEAQERRSRQA